MADNFTDRLRSAIDGAALSKSSIALELDVTPATVTGWLNGKQPKLANLIRLSSALNISLDWLITGTGDHRLNGVLHITKSEANLIQTLRTMPNHSRETLMDFLAWSTGFNAAFQLDRQSQVDSILRQSRLAMVMFDSLGTLMDVNQPFLDLLHIKAEDRQLILGTQVADWILTEQRAELVMAISQAKRDSLPIDMRCDFLCYRSNKTVPAVLYANYDTESSGYFSAMIFVLEAV